MYRDIFVCSFFFSSRRRHTRSVSAFLLNRSSDLEQRNAAQNVYRSVEHDQKTGLTTFGQFHQHHSQMPREIGERFSRNAETDLVCRLLLEKKKNKRKSKHSAMLRNKETRHRMFIGLLNTTRKLA